VEKILLNFPLPGPREAGEGKKEIDSVSLIAGLFVSCLTLAYGQKGQVLPFGGISAILWGIIQLGEHAPMPYTPILATLAYVMSPDGRQVLLIHRNTRATDHHLGKYNGLGGKLDSTEDVVAGVKREIREEAGLECEQLQLRGTISWPGFGKNGEDWFGFIFRVNRFSGAPLAANPEGTLTWVPVEDIFDLPLWEGDRYFLPMVFSTDPRQFHGVMPYKNGRPVGWLYNLI
jgi:8-oxo-dGTP diphosphatase